jgi:hypothetical protein
VELAETYGAGTCDDGITVFVPEHPNRHRSAGRWSSARRAGDEWARFEGGAVAFLVALLSGEFPNDFILADDSGATTFVRHPWRESQAAN